jgi:glycosyltransferase involved in cell wall biosynthesis
MERINAKDGAFNQERVEYIANNAASNYSSKTNIKIEGCVSLPLASIVITNFNYAKYVINAIQSALKQLYDRIECVVVDDCSSDNSVEVISSYLECICDPRVRFVRLPSNLGQMAAMKTGFENCSGPFVNFLDADDVLRPDFLKTHILTHLNSARSAAVSASDTIQIDSHGQILEGTFHCLMKDRGADHSNPNSGVLPIPRGHVPGLNGTVLSYKKSHRGALRYIDSHFYGWPVVASSALVFRRDILAIIFPDDTSVGRICADYYLYHLAHIIGGTITIPSAHSFWRLHQKNNYGSGPVLGGYYTPRPTGKLKQIEAALNTAIATHITRNIEFWSELLGQEKVATVLKRGFFPKC